MTTQSDSQLQEYLDFATELAKDAGIDMLEGFNSVQTTWKADNTPVTEIDERINQMVIDRIKEKYPTHNVLGEEQSHQSEKESNLSWVCDPIDGTRAYTMGMHASVFALALCEDGNPIVGVLFDPFSNRLISAASGLGASLNQEHNVSVSDRSEVPGASLGIPFKQSFTYDISEGIQKLWKQNCYVFNTFSVLYLGTFVAQGKLDAVIFPNDTGYDAAALKVIVEEAGGKMTDIHGNPQRYDKPIKGMIASNGKIHDHLIELIS